MSKIIIKAKNFYDGIQINIAEAIENKPSLINEDISKEDMKTIEKMVNKTLEVKIKEIVEKEITGTKNEKFVTDIVRNCIGQLYKQLWSKRTAWLSGIVNKPN